MNEQFSILTFIGSSEFNDDHFQTIIRAYEYSGLACLNQLTYSSLASSIQDSFTYPPFQFELTPFPFGKADNKLIFQELSGLVSLELILNNESYDTSLSSVEYFRDYLVEYSLCGSRYLF